MNIIISNSSQDPIYVQIRKQLSQLILNGGLKGGDQLQSLPLYFPIGEAAVPLIVHYFYVKHKSPS
ncbi:hypothetical protein ACT453_47715, partial [Bacillus sp. D-CC]